MPFFDVHHYAIYALPTPSLFQTARPRGACYARCPSALYVYNDDARLH